MNTTLFGIDLGTTNSAISVMTGSKNLTPEIITLTSGRKTMPSCVQWTKADGFEVGYKPYKNRWKSNVVYSIKRHMGTEHQTTLTDQDGNSITLLPEEVSTEILKELAKEAEKAGYGKVYNVTITVPAYFNNKQRQATIKAGELAGMNVVSIVNEPTSAALAYGLDKKLSTGNILVYDLGGGTFDASLLKVEHTGVTKKIGLIKLANKTKEQSILNVLSNGGNNKLGGDDIDLKILEYVCETLDDMLKEKGHDTNTLTELPHETKEKLIAQIEQEKKLGANISARVIVEATLTTGLAISETVALPHSAVVKATQHIFNQTILSVQECLETSPEKKFGKVVLVGGSTKSEPLRAMIASYFSQHEIYMELNPDESISLGAAVMTNITMGDSSIKLFDVIPLPIGIEVNSRRDDGTIREGFFRKIIQKDSQLPSKGVHLVRNTEDTGAGISLKIYQGTKQRAANNTLIGIVNIEELPKKPAGEVEIKINMLVDLNGILNVKVIVDGEEHNATFSSVFGNSEDKVKESTSKSLDEEFPLKDMSEAKNRLSVMPDSLTDSKTTDKEELTLTEQEESISFNKDFKSLELSENPKVRRWSSNLRKWNVSDLDKKEMNKKLKDYDNGLIEEKEVIADLQELRKKYVTK